MCERPSIFIQDKPIFSPERMLHKDYYHKNTVEKKILVVSRGLMPKWTGGKLPVVKEL
jgi:hypothetical protein